MSAAVAVAYRGCCHCGGLEFTYRTGIEPAHWSVRACQCSFCRRHGALSTSDPSGRLAFRIALPDLLIRYRFGQRATDFLICGRCGIYVGARIDTPQGSFGIVNLNTLEPCPAGLPSPSPMHYDGEAPADRRARREQRWTPIAAAGG